MDAKWTLKCAAYYHALALSATALGGGIVLAGIALALGPGALADVSLTDPATVADLVAGISWLPLIIGGTVGVFVRRVGRTAAFLYVQARATEAGVDVPVELLASHLSGRVRDDIAAVINEEQANVDERPTPRDQGAPSTNT